MSTTMHYQCFGLWCNGFALSKKKPMLLQEGSVLDTLLLGYDYNPKAMTIPLIDFYDNYTWPTEGERELDFDILQEDDIYDLNIMFSNMSFTSLSHNDSFVERRGMTLVPENHYTKSYHSGSFKGSLTNVTPLNCFKLIFDNKVEQLFLDGMNKRRQARVDNIGVNEGTRGRPLSQTISSDRAENKLNYSARWEKSFDVEDMNKFLSCFFAMSVTSFPTMKDYWETPSTNKLGHSYFFQNRLPMYKYCEMYRCIDIDVDAWLDKIKNKVQLIWDVSTSVSIDESMIPHKGRNCPHHVFIPRKPHPHGIKLYTASCDSGYLFNWKIHKRTNEEPPDKLFHRVRNTKEVQKQNFCIHGTLLMI